MVNLTITPAIKTALHEVDRLHLEGFSKDQFSGQTLPPNSAVGDPIGHDEVIAISRLLKTHNKKKGTESVPFRLEDLLRGSGIFLEPPKPTAEPTSSYKSLMRRLRREEEARAYERMINHPPPCETFADRFASGPSPALFPTTQREIDEGDDITYADINRQLALIINILVSIVACSVAIWMASRHWSTPSRLGFSMGGSVLVGVAEVVVYAGYIQRMKDAREKSKKQQEVKKIISTWVIGGQVQSDDQGNVKEIVSQPVEQDTVHRRRVKRVNMVSGD